MDPEQEDISETPPDEGHRNELVLDNWKLLLIFFVGLVICVIFFAAGLIVGRHQPRVADTNTAALTETSKAGGSSGTSAPPARVRQQVVPATTAPVPEVQASEEPATLPAREIPTTTQGNEAVAPPTTLGRTTPATVAEEHPPAPAAPPPTTEIAIKPTAPGDKAELAVPPTTGGFRVQIAAMKTAAEAQAVVDILKKKGFESFVTPPKGSNDTFYRVQMGDYADRAAAQEVMLKLQQAGEKPVLKRQ